MSVPSGTTTTSPTRNSGRNWRLKSSVNSDSGGAQTASVSFSKIPCNLSPLSPLYEVEARSLPASAVLVPTEIR